MTTKFYQINGVWNTYQYWHDNYGYTTEPTQSMNFKSSASGTWGTNVNPGYFASPGGDTIDNWSFWSEGIVGWKDIDQLALAGAYPATAIDILLERNGLIANAVYVDDSDELYYLIDGYLSDGWRSWDEVEADGWQVYEGAPPYYMVVNETTGEVVYSISETEENPSMVFSQVGNIEMPDSEMITVYETGVPVQSFYFTTNGRNETQNTTLPVDSSIPLYWADGSRVNDSEGWASEYNGSPVLALTKADMNVFAALQNDKVISVDHGGTDCLDFYGAVSTQEITIDANFGDAVSIPDGYTIQSVKSTTAYSFPTSITAIDSWNFTVKYGGKDVYSDDITSSDVCVNDLPCLYIFQYVSTSTGYRVSTTPAKYNGNITAITDVSVNSGSNDFVVMTCTAQSSANAQDIVSHASAYPGYFEYYGSDGNIVAYFFDVPQTLWKFENDSFSWLGDASSTSDLAYWYNSKAVRIKCVKSVSQSRSAWAALLEKVFPDILTLWAKITDNSEKMYLQTRVINTSTPNSAYLYALYTDEALTQRFVIDSNKTYELGVFKGQNFAPYDIQDVSQMPSTTVSGSGAVSGFLLVDQSGAYLWAATNNTYSTYVNAPGNTIPFKCRVSEPPAPSLPTVEITNGLAVVGSSADYCYSRSFVPIYDSSQNRILYDSTKSYVVQIGNGSGTIWGIEFFCASDSSGYLVAWNRTNVTLLVLGASIYSCSSNSAYRVIVSDSSNVKYPAFAYDLSGTTYYYVCDGVQTDWTDDLSTIGYSLVTGSEAYLTSLGSSETTDTLIGNSSFYLYSSSGASLYGNQSKKYVLIGQFLKDGTNVTNNGMDSRLTTGMNCSAVNVSSSTSSWNKLMLAGTFYSYNAFRITYLEV